MAKKIYLKPLWWKGLEWNYMYQSLIDNAPPGYEFISPVTPFQARMSTLASKARLPGLLLNHVIDKAIPVNLAKAYLEAFKKIPEDIDLVYAPGHLVFQKRPWVVDMEHVTYLVDNNVKHFARYRGVVRKLLTSEHCKKIFSYSDFAMKGLLSNLQCPELEQKLERLPNSVPKKDFTKKFDESKVKILFVASARAPRQFEIKGGPDALAAFELLSEKYDNLELVVRSEAAAKLKRRFRGYSNIRIIEQVIPWETLEQEFKTADIFLLPAHSPPFSVFLDAMSYELPVVTIDAPGNAEIVEDGKTGLVAGCSDKVPYFIEGLKFVPDYGSRAFLGAIKTPDLDVVRGLVEKLSILTENVGLRRKMGRAGRWEVEHGRFSIQRRNEKLKRIFDEATA